MAAKRAAATTLVAGNGPFMFQSATTSGLDNVDFWVGGLAERQAVFGGLLGSTFNFIFEKQLENLQDGDRFYYLQRTDGLNFRFQLEGNSFAELLRRNTDFTGGMDVIFNTARLHLQRRRAHRHGDDRSRRRDVASSPCRRHEDVLRSAAHAARTSPSTAAAGDDKFTSDIGDDTMYGNAGNDRSTASKATTRCTAATATTSSSAATATTCSRAAAATTPSAGPGFGADLAIGGDGNDFMLGGDDGVEYFGGAATTSSWTARCGPRRCSAAPATTGSSTAKATTAACSATNGNVFDLLAGLSPVGGDDVMGGGPGQDNHFGEGGDDVFVMSEGTNKFFGDYGFDWVTLRGWGLPEFVELGLLALPNVPLNFNDLRNVYRFVDGASGWDSRRSHRRLEHVLCDPPGEIAECLDRRHGADDGRARPRSSGGARR
jgi:hypothetical protein